MRDEEELKLTPGSRIGKSSKRWRTGSVPVLSCYPNAVIGAGTKIAKSEIVQDRCWVGRRHTARAGSLALVLWATTALTHRREIEVVLGQYTSMPRNGHLDKGIRTAILSEKEG